MTTIGEVIRTNKPRITPSTLRSYVSMLNGLQKKVNIDEILLPDVIEKYETKIKDYLKDTPPRYRKTILSALVSVLLGKQDSETLKSFRKQLLTDSQVYENEVKEQKLTDNQKEGYISWDTILEVKNKMKDVIEPLLKGKKALPAKYRKMVQQWALLNLYTNQEPRRAMEIATLKINPDDKTKDNYIDKKGNFIFNSFKTAKYLGQQKVAIHKDTLKAIKDWIRVRGVDSDYVFLDSEDKPLNSTKLGNLIKDIFDPLNITINILRHSFVKHMLGDINLESIQEMAHKLGQVRPIQTLEYVKRNTEEIEKVNENKLKSVGKGKKNDK